MDPNDFFQGLLVIACALAGGCIFYVFGSLISPEKKKKKEPKQKLTALNDKDRKWH